MKTIVWLAVIWSLALLVQSIQGQSIWINEFHYDNTGTDENEFIEVAYDSSIGDDITAYSLVLYNGNGGSTYDSYSLSPGSTASSGIHFTSVTVEGLQNGPDGIGLVKTGNNLVLEFLSYEGVVTATDGPAAGMTSHDVGVSEDGGVTLATQSLQRIGQGCTVSDFTSWTASSSSTRNSVNQGQVFGPTCTKSQTAAAWINEFHYDNEGADTNEFVEIAYHANMVNEITTQYQLVLYNGNGGLVYQTLSIPAGNPVGNTGISLSVVATPGLQNGIDGMALVDVTTAKVAQFLSYEGIFTAMDGPAVDMTSTMVNNNVVEDTLTPVGYSIQSTGTGCAPDDFTWSLQPATAGAVNSGQIFDCQSTTPGGSSSGGGHLLDDTMLEQSSGSGSTEAIFMSAGHVVNFGKIPAGIADVYIELDSIIDVDIQLFALDPATGSEVPLLNRIINSSGKRQHFDWNGVRVEYSGYRGEDRDTTLGEEFVFLSGILPWSVTVKVYAEADSGSVVVKYWWGYYTLARGVADILLQSRLHEIIHGHNKISYSEAWEGIKRSDQYVDDSNFVMTLYSRRPTLKADQDDGSNEPDDWNREHVWPKSHGDFGTNLGPGTDLHALRAADRSVNSERSSKDFAQGDASLSSEEAREDCPDCRETDDSFEPPDEVKGAVARMVFYMATRYNGDSDSHEINLTVVDGTGTLYGAYTAGNGQLGDLSTLLAWNDGFPPTNEEYYRNNIIFQIQGNRNPFIDHPEWVSAIFSNNV